VLLNVFADIAGIAVALLNFTSCSAVQPLKALVIPFVPTLDRLERSTLVKDVQPLQAIYNPSVPTLDRLERSTLVKDVHP